MQLPELMAPVRDAASFTAAINAGADAVYFGVGHLNMRVSTAGIEAEMLANVVTRAHAEGVKVYVTLNTIVYDGELPTIREHLQLFRDVQVDAVICWDPAIIELVREFGLPLHISTQASISNVQAARFYASLGAERIVLARELTLEQISELRKNAGVEVEVFAHGAMCVAVSGRCFISQFIDCRSANRGNCLQPCRHEYRVINEYTGDELKLSNGYVLSPKDLCSIAMVDQLVAAGIDAIKLEGRARSVEYTSTVTSCYRRALDAVAAGEYTDALKEELLEELADVYNRDFSTGFLLGRPGDEAWSTQKNSQARTKKVFAGKVINYYQKKQIAHLELLATDLRIGDTLQFQGPTTGMERFTVTELRDDATGEFVEEIEAQRELTVPVPFVVRKSDEVYKVVKR